MKHHWPIPRKKPQKLGLLPSQLIKSKLTTATKIVVITGVSIGYQAHKEAIDPYYETALQRQQYLRARLSKIPNNLDNIKFGDWVL